MSSNGDWVRRGTPREAEWEDEQSEYGLAMDPANWDDYASEQSARVQARVRAGDPINRVPVDFSDADPAGISDEKTPPGGVEWRSEEEETTTAVDLVDRAPQDNTGLAPKPAPRFEDDPAPLAAPGHALDEAPEQTEPIVLETTGVADAEIADEPVVEVAEIADEPAVQAPEEPVAEPAQETVADEGFQRPRLGAEVPEQQVAAPAGLFRDEVPTEEPTAVIPTQDPVEEVAEKTTSMPTPVPPEELDAERRMREKIEAERAARNERLGVVATSKANESRDVGGKAKRTTDGFAGSFGLIVLRFVTAGILGIIGYQILTAPAAAAERLAATALPQPQLMAWIIGFTLAGIALALIIGLLVRLAGFLMVVLGIGSLVLYRWGSFSPFIPGVEGFSGDRDLLLVAVGLLFVTLGGGALGVDGAFRRARARSKAERNS